MSEIAKQVFDFRASKGITTAQSDEHQRNWTEKGWQWAAAHGNYDRTRAHLNFEIAPGGRVQPIDTRRSIPQRMADSLAARGIKDPNAGLAEPRFRTIVNIIFEGSRWRMHEIAFGDQKVNLDHGADNSHIRRCPEIEQWAKDIYDAVCRKWGEDNIAGFYVHLDETNPHIHCTLLPIDGRGKFAFKRLFAGADKYEYKERIRALHDYFAEVNAPWGLRRGDSIEQTRAKHCNPEDYLRQLSSTCSTLEDEIERSRTLLVSIQADTRLAERRVKGLTTMVQKLETSRADLQRQIEELSARQQSGESDCDDTMQRLRRLQSDLENVETKLADKRTKLDEADRTLSNLKTMMEQTRERTELLKAEGYKAAGNIQQEMQLKLSSALLPALLREFSTRLPTLSFTDRAQFDETMLRDLAEQGDKVMTCALMLFGGFINQAIQFAETHGGGGGSTSRDWGRDPNEEERAWALRCMQQACRMMRPATKHRIRR
jgi:hypothetical protein